VATSGKKAEHFVGRMVLNEVPLIDGHNDVANNLYLIEKNILKEFNFNDLKQNPKWVNNDTEYGSHTDLTRLQDGKVHGQFWAAYASCDSNNKDAVARTLEQIDVIKRLIIKKFE